MSIVYVIESVDGAPLYVGSSFGRYDNRISQHKTGAKKSPMALYQHIRELGGWSTVTARIVQAYTDITKEGLRKEEQLHQEILRPTYNQRLAYTILKGAQYNRAYRTIKPRSYFNESLQRWRLANPEKVKAHTRTSYTRQRAISSLVSMLSV